jgi:hypothetical protein
MCKMFVKHQSKIMKWAMTKPDNTFNLVLMVSLSIRQPWAVIGKQLQDVQENGMASKFLFGSKKDLYAYMMDNKQDIFDILKATKAGKVSQADCLYRLTQVPGLGLAKAGFVMQLAIGMAGCIDSHNVTMYGVNPNALKMGKVKAEKALEKAKMYLELCDKLGGTEKLWDNWCNFVATRHPKHFEDGYDVSARHCSYLGIKPQSFMERLFS